MISSVALHYSRRVHDSVAPTLYLGNVTIIFVAKCLRYYITVHPDLQLITPFAAANCVEMVQLTLHLKDCIPCPLHETAPSHKMALSCVTARCAFISGRMSKDGLSIVAPSRLSQGLHHFRLLKLEDLSVLLGIPIILYPWF